MTKIMQWNDKVAVALRKGAKADELAGDETPLDARIAKALSAAERRGRVAGLREAR